jgi:hypothetical protein
MYPFIHIIKKWERRRKYQDVNRSQDAEQQNDFALIRFARPRCPGWLAGHGKWNQLNGLAKAGQSVATSVTCTAAMIPARTKIFVASLKRFSKRSNP